MAPARNEGREVSLKVKNRLSAYRDTQKVLESKQRAMERLIEQLTGITAALDEYKVEGQEVRDKVGELVADMEIAIQDVMNAAQDCTETFEEVSRIISLLASEEYRWLLTMRYLECLSWREIAATMEIAQSSCRYKEERALEVLDILLTRRITNKCSVST